MVTALYKWTNHCIWLEYIAEFIWLPYWWTLLFLKSWWQGWPKEAIIFFVLSLCPVQKKFVNVLFGGGRLRSQKYSSLIDLLSCRLVCICVCCFCSFYSHLLFTLIWGARRVGPFIIRRQSRTSVYNSTREEKHSSPTTTQPDNITAQL